MVIAETLREETLTVSENVNVSNGFGPSMLRSNPSKVGLTASGVNVLTSRG